MKMYHGQYLRVESRAGGVGCTVRQFIRAAHKLLAPSARTRAQRAARHEWLRDGLHQRYQARALFRCVS